MSRAEMLARGWDQCDIILVTGDAYVDHPAFGAALIGRWLEHLGYRVGIIAAPSPDNIEHFQALGPPRLFWGVTAGNLDSQLARLTVMRKRRRDDPYLPEGQGDLRPPNATIVYVTKVRQAFRGGIQKSESGIQNPGSPSRVPPSSHSPSTINHPPSTIPHSPLTINHSPFPINHQPSTIHHSSSSSSAPVIIGGIEASLRRFPYYDYWTDSVKRSILFDSKADLLVYGMAEYAIAEAAARLSRGETLSGIPGTAEIQKKKSESRIQNPEEIISPATLPASGALNPEATLLPAFESLSARTPAGYAAFNQMTREVLLDAAGSSHRPFLQPCGDRVLVVHPPAPPLTPDALDSLYALPFTRRPHPAYGKARIAAYDMIRDSITTHRGCYGACAFCAIATHQGKAVVSRSRASILAEIRAIASAPDFHGAISDLGGPTANMYGTRCRRDGANCRRPSCLTPDLCANLETDAGALLELWRAARKLPGVNHVFVTSGVRFDLALAQEPRGYIEELASHHVCGRLKIAPEHVAANVLRLMRKPSDESRQQFMNRFRVACRRAGKPQPVVEYFISGHPGCTLDDMIELALYLKRENIRPEQVQDFYPAPLTAAAAMFYTGVDPMSGEAVYVARTDNEKAMQRALLLVHDPKFHRKAREALRKAGRDDLIGRHPHCLVP